MMRPELPRTELPRSELPRSELPRTESTRPYHEMIRGSLFLDMLVAVSIQYPDFKRMRIEGFDSRLLPQFLQLPNFSYSGIKITKREITILLEDDQHLEHEITCKLSVTEKTPNIVVRPELIRFFKHKQLFVEGLPGISLSSFILSEDEALQVLRAVKILTVEAKAKGPSAYYLEEKTEAEKAMEQITAQKMREERSAVRKG